MSNQMPPRPEGSQRASSYHAHPHTQSIQGDVSSTDFSPPDVGRPTNAPTVWRLVVGESLQVIIPAMILALMVHLFLAQATVVYGQSMEPNLYEHERLIIDKLTYRLRAPQRNDIIVLDLPHMEELLVKRIIGLPGEVIEIRHGQVYINGEPAEEPFPHDLGFQSSPAVRLGPLTYYVLGDNRENSNDSRAFGPVRRENILGRVWLRYWPLSQLKAF
jgi:signal peptidase I